MFSKPRVFRILGILLFFLFSAHCSGQEDSLVLTGRYLGQNLYILNPYGENGKGYCILSMWLNGKPVQLESESAIEIDFSFLGLQTNDSIHLVILHRTGCLPNILNTQIVCRSFRFNYRLMAKDSATLAFRSLVPSHAYALEQYKWNKWTVIDTVRSLPGRDTSEFDIPIRNYLHSGTNQFRINSLSTDALSESYPVSIPDRKSSENKTPDDIWLNKTRDKHYFRTHPIEFRQDTYYEVYTHYGDLQLKGYGKSCSVSQLPAGSYFLLYENTTAEFSLR